MERIKSQILLKRNLKALIKHRGKTQGGLARHLMGRDYPHADSWMSHILDEDDLQRELPMEMWDKAAEYLGVDTYHFFIPGVALNWDTERRSGTDRRSWKERRKGIALPERPHDLDLMLLIRALPQAGVEEATEAVMKILDRLLKRPPAKSTSAAGRANNRGTT